MSRVLVFGDSLSWGFDAADGGRFPIESAWPAVMAARLGGDVEVLVEALNGRTTVVDSPYAPARSGAQMLAPLLESHLPLDLVIIMLGTNDLQVPLGGSALSAAAGMWTLVDIALASRCGPGGTAPRVLVVAPPALTDPHGFMGLFLAGQEEESRRLAGHYETLARQAAVDFFDAGAVVRPGPADGVHLDRDGNAALGVALAETVGALLPGPST